MIWVAKCILYLPLTILEKYLIAFLWNPILLQMKYSILHTWPTYPSISSNPFTFRPTLIHSLITFRSNKFVSDGVKNLIETITLSTNIIDLSINLRYLPFFNSFTYLNISPFQLERIIFLQILLYSCASL